MKIKKDLKILILLIYLCISTFAINAQTWPAGIHDPSSIVKCDDTYWVFGTGDGIYSIYSKDLITWQAGPTPFTKTNFPEWINDYVNGTVDGSGKPVFHGGFWAPDIIHMNDQYYLYYSCSEWGTMTSTIGCVTNKTLNPNDPDYKWIDAGFLGIWSYQHGLALNAIDPAVMRGPDGKIWMVYGSFNEEGTVVTELDSVSGKPKTYDGNLPGTSIANSWTGPQNYNYGEGEGASMINRDGYFYLFYNKGGCCAGIASTYYMVMGRSRNPRGPFLDKTGKALKINGQASGGTIVFRHDNSRGTDDRYFGPGHFGMYSENGVDYVTFHYYDPSGFYPNPDVNNQGGPTLGLAKLVWEEDGWPSISLNFVDHGVYTLENIHSGKVADAELHVPVEGAALYQYTADSSSYSQKWVFTALGGGEYSIHNYANPEFFVEVGGTTSSSISLTAEYDGAINQRFRTLTDVNGKTIVYPSVKDVAWGLSIPTNNDTRLYLRSVSSQDFMRWKTIPFDESFSVSENRLEVEHSAGISSSIVVKSNGLWSARVLNDSWMIVEASGIKNDTLNLIFDENTNGKDRKNRVYVTSNGGESFLITVTQLGKPTSISDVKDKNELIIYPNPAEHEVYIKCRDAGILSVFNPAGQKVSEFIVENGNSQINIGELNSGLYFFRLQTDRGTWVEKVIKK